MPVVSFEKRLPVLRTALLIEGIAAPFLAKLIGVENPKDSYSFSDTSTALSFSSKILLLIDIGALSRHDKAKFFTFMEIRNQFVHNISAKDIETCLPFLPKGKDSYILKTYPQDKKLAFVKQMELAVDELTKDVFAIAANLMKKIEAKIKVDVESEITKQAFDKLVKALWDKKETFNKLIDKEIEKGTTFGAKEVKQIFAGFISSVKNNK